MHTNLICSLLTLPTYNTGKPIADAGKEAMQDLSEEERQTQQARSEESEAFRRWMKDVLGERITRVEASSRLVDSPATLVQSEYGVSPSMQKYLRAQVRPRLLCCSSFLFALNDVYKEYLSCDLVLSKCISLYIRAHLL